MKAKRIAQKTGHPINTEQIKNEAEKCFKRNDYQKVIELLTTLLNNGKNWTRNH